MKHAYSSAIPASSAGGKATARPASAAKRAGWPARLLDTLFNWQRRVEDRRRLSELDDRLLADMGISRTDAQYESSKPFWKA